MNDDNGQLDYEDQEAEEQAEMRDYNDYPENGSQE